jgi:hypothetical protein
LLSVRVAGGLGVCIVVSGCLAWEIRRRWLALAEGHEKEEAFEVTWEAQVEVEGEEIRQNPGGEERHCGGDDDLE